MDRITHTQKIRHSLRLGTDYAGPGLLTISPANGGEGSLLEIDGQAALLLTRPVIDLSSIIVLQ